MSTDGLLVSVTFTAKELGVIKEAGLFTAKVTKLLPAALDAAKSIVPPLKTS
jgi:hypothetical protein